MFVRANLRLRNKCISSIGELLCSSCREGGKHHSATIGIAMPRLVQRCVLPRTRPQTTRACRRPGPARRTTLLDMRAREGLHDHMVSSPQSSPRGVSAQSPCIFGKVSCGEFEGCSR
jgi:hypothetical protein